MLSDSSTPITLGYPGKAAYGAIQQDNIPVAEVLQ